MQNYSEYVTQSILYFLYIERILLNFISTMIQTRTKFHTRGGTHSPCCNNPTYIRFPELNQTTVEPSKTDTPREIQKCPSQRGVRLIEVLISIDIRQKELKDQLMVVVQDLINIQVVYQSEVKILQSFAYYEIIILNQST